MTAGTAILLRLWSDVREAMAKGSERYSRCAAGLGFVEALEIAVNVLTTSQALSVTEELENDLIVHSPHAQSLADYIRKVKSL